MKSLDNICDFTLAELMRFTDGEQTSLSDINEYQYLRPCYFLNIKDQRINQINQQMVFYYLMRYGIINKVMK